jgi:xylulokinase
MSWLRNVVLEGRHSYQEMDAMGAAVAPGSDGALVYPFGNGVERILGNVSLGAHVCGVDFGRHGLGHLMRAVQEGIAFAMFYGVQALPRPDVIRASNANLFLSPVFAQTVADLTGARVEIHDTQGVFGAAWGAAIGAGAVERPSSASVVRSYLPSKGEKLTTAYARWKSGLARLLEQEGWLPQ